MKTDAFCIKNDGFSPHFAYFVLKNDALCTRNDGFLTIFSHKGQLDRIINVEQRALTRA